LLAGCGGPYSTLDPAGPAASAAASLWWAMFIGATLVLLAVTGLWLYALRRDPGEIDETEARRIERHWLIGGGLILPLASITLLLGFGIPIGHQMLPLPRAEGEIVTIEVTGRQWELLVRYPDHGIELVNEVHIPTNTPVDVHLTSADVIHSFWVPRLGGKLDMIPGHTNVHRLQADQPGIYRGQCAEFCGLLHAHMRFTLEAHLPEAFEAWLEQRTAEPAQEESPQ
jgi:cytochrome c oxidase subunit II